MKKPKFDLALLFSIAFGEVGAYAPVPTTTKPSDTKPTTTLAEQDDKDFEKKQNRQTTVTNAA